MSKKTEGLDQTICQQMSSLVELLTTSGKPVLNPEIMKKFKKICRTSDGYTEYAFGLLMSQLTVDHSEIRLSTFQMIDELFNRSHAFRELLVADFQTFLELAAGINQDFPLPPPKLAAQTMKSLVFKSIQQWYEKFGIAYKKLALGYSYLKTCKKVDFGSIQAMAEVERKQKEDAERKLAESRKIKIEKVLNELNDTRTDIELCVTEIENSIQLLMPHPENFFIPTSDPEQASGDAGDSLGAKDGVGAATNDISKQETSTESDTDDSHCIADTRKFGNCDSATSKETCSRVKSQGQSSSQEILSVSEMVDVNKTNKNKSDGDMKTGDSGEGQEQNNANSGAREESEDGAVFDNGGKDDKADDDGDAYDDEDCQEGFEAVDDSTSGLRHQLGLFDHKFAITVEMDDTGSQIKETEDNKEVIQGLREQYRLVKTKYMPAVKRWIQVMTKNEAKQENIKQAEDLKSQLEDTTKKCIELEVVTVTKKDDSDSDSDEEFEEVEEKEGYEADVPEHVRLEAARSASAEASTSRGKGQSRRGRKNTTSAKTATGKSSLSYWNLSERVQEEDKTDMTTGKSTVCKLKSSTTATSTITSAMMNIEPSSSVAIKQEPGTSSSPPPADKSKKPHLMERAPVISYGLDLEHWEDPSNIKVPERVKYEDTGRVWKGNSANGDDTPNTMDVEALTSRSFTFAGEFKPVKWKCRAPMPNGKLCERMDREKCPFHGKIIARDEEGIPSDPADAAAQANEMVADTEDGLESSKDKGKGKGKGKQKAEKRKYPNLTDIKKPKSTCRSRLESKIFKKATLKKVNAALDAVAAKRLADKFGNQFNYSLK